MAMTPERAVELNEMSMALDLLVEDEGVLTPLEAAREYFSHYEELPQPLRYWHNECARRSNPMFDGAKKSGTRLFGAGDELRFYSLHLEDFALPEVEDGSYDFLEPDNPLYLFQNAPLWEYWIKTSFKDEIFWKIEGNSTRICVHVIAGKNAGLLHLPRSDGSEKIKSIYDPERLLAYLFKPPFAFKPDGKAAANGFRGYDLEDTIIRLSHWISEKRFFYNRSRLALCFAHKYDPKLTALGDELEQQSKKYAKPLYPDPQTWMQKTENHIHANKANYPEWFNMALYESDSKPFMLHRVQGFFGVRGKTENKPKINPSDIRIKLQSCYNLREFQKQELALIEAAREQGTNNGRSRFQDYLDKFAP